MSILTHLLRVLLGQQHRSHASVQGLWSSLWWRWCRKLTVEIIISKFQCRTHLVSSPKRILIERHWWRKWLISQSGKRTVVFSPRSAPSPPQVHADQLSETTLWTRLKITTLRTIRILRCNNKQLLKSRNRWTTSQAAPLSKTQLSRAFMWANSAYRGVTCPIESSYKRPPLITTSWKSVGRTYPLWKWWWWRQAICSFRSGTSPQRTITASKHLREYSLRIATILESTVRLNN